MNTIQSHRDLSDEAFLKQFEDTSLPPSLFNHEAHLRLAWLHIRRSGKEQAKLDIKRQLQNYVRSVGAEDKYHETLTIASVEAVHHFICHAPTEQFEDFIELNAPLKNQFKALINSHYSFDIFDSIPAKKAYIAPDVVAFETTA